MKKIKPSSCQCSSCTCRRWEWFAEGITLTTSTMHIIYKNLISLMLLATVKCKWFCGSNNIYFGVFATQALHSWSATLIQKSPRLIEFNTHPLIKMHIAFPKIKASFMLAVLLKLSMNLRAYSRNILIQLLHLALSPQRLWSVKWRFCTWEICRWHRWSLVTAFAQ